MKKKVFSLMMTLLLAFIGVAKAEVVTIGDGTSTTYVTPFNSLWGYSFVEQIYTADEIGTAGTINSISFNLSSGPQTNQIEVFMKNVARSTFAGTSDYETVTASDMVFSGTVTFNSGWTTITLDTPFAYDGTSNLLVGMHEFTSGYSTLYFYYTSATDKVVTFHSDSYNPDPYNLGSYSGNSYVSPNRANVQLDITAGGGGGGETVMVEIGTGTATTNVYPTQATYNYCFNEMIYPAASIGTAGSISKIGWHYNGANELNRSVVVFMKNVSRTNFASTTDWEAVSASDIVYTGTLTSAAVDQWVTLTLNTPFEYDGTSNLMIAVDDNTGSWNSRYWYYTTSVDNCCMTYYNDSNNPDPYNPGSASGRHSTLPNLQLTITTPGGGGGFEDKLHVKYVNADEEEIIDSLNLGVRPINAWMEPFQFTMYSEGPTYTVTHLDFTPSDGMFTVEGEELPFQVTRNDEVNMTIGTNATTAGLIERQFVAITEGDRAAHVWPIVVEMYEPAIPDVVEKAYDFGTINPSFSYNGVPSEITPTELHNDYTLPFPEIPEGVDAVYQFTVENDLMINAYVDEQAENGKVALYKEDFNGEGGPMAHNNYTGIEMGGGSSALPYEALIGDETSTSTTGYFPMYYLYNYSLSTQLFTAAEMAEAGANTAAMSSVAWYSESTYNYNVQNVSIWMANVTDVMAPAMSPLATGMTLVYQGNFQEVVGWNEFAFNAGSFAWDGTSNVLVMVQMNNGSWSSAIYWKSHNPGFQAMTYAYTDSAPYDANTTSYSLYTSTTARANTRFTSLGGRNGNRDVVTIGEGTGTTYYFPIDNYFNYSCTEQVYLAEEIGTAGTINSISFDYVYGTAYTAANVTMYMKNVERTNFASSSDFEALTASDIVWTGSIAPTASGWYTINLDTPFQYDGTSNLLVAFYDGTSGYPGTSYTFHQTATADAKGLRYYSDSSNPNPYDLGSYTGSKMTYNYRANIQLDITPGGGGTGIEYAAGPVIENLPLTPGTYYLVASATQPDYTVYINADNMPCPQVEGFAFNPTPADNEDGIEPGSVTLRWSIPAYATGWRLIFGSTYHPEPGHPQTVMYPEDGSFSTDLANSFTVRNLWNNTNYFWRVEFNNDGCPEGVSSPVWGFTTHLNIPENLRAVDETVFDDEQIVLNWNAVVDRTFRMYNVYRDGQFIGSTQVNNIGNATYTDGPLAYNMGGYTYYVTAVYDEGESAPSNTVNVKVSGRGNVNGHVYEQDGTTGIAGATVTMVGLDEFGVQHTYNFQTNAQGYYSGAVYAGSYNGSAACEGYQTIYEPVQGNPIAITYNVTTSPVDYMLDENFDAPCTVIAEYYPDSLDPHSPYVKVYWGCGLPGEEIIEDFETGDFSMFDWQVDGSYPWSITTTAPYEGQYCMMSGGAGVASVTSNMTVTVEIPADGVMSYFGKISSEQNWDYGYFYIDGVQKAQYTGVSNWAEKTFDITAGTHTFQWQYTKDGSVNANDDRFYVDYITFYKRPEPPQPAQPGWHTYAEGDFNNAVGSNVGTSRWAYQYPVSVIGAYAGFTMTKVSLFSDNQYMAVGGNYTCTIYQGGAEPMAGTAISTITVDVPSNQNAWVDFDLTTPVQVTGSDVLWVVWTANTTVSSWPAGCTDVSLIEEGTWWSAGVEAGYGWEHQTYGTWTMRQYFADRSGRGFYSYASDNAHMPAIDVPVVAKGAPVMPVKGQEVVTTTCVNPNTVGSVRTANNSRVLHHYNIYRTNCYNDGPYTAENTVLLATSWPYDTVYIDVEWADLPAGVYKWGVGAVYQGNRGQLTESEISWAAPQNVTRSATADNDPNPVAGSEGIRAPWDLITTFTAPEAAQYGVVTDGQYIYTSNWGYASAAHNFYKYDMQGNMIEGFEIPGCGTLRGMTYDGQHVYGVACTNTVYCIDLNSHTLVSSFTTPYGAMRGITYDPQRNGFWVIGNWSGNLTLIDYTGAVVTTGPAPTSASDLAYYKDENNEEHVYCFNNGDNGVYDYNITTNTLGGSVFNFNAVPGFNAGTSGGCHVAEYNGVVAFFGDMQQDPNLIGIYELRSGGVGPTPTPTPGSNINQLAEARESETIWSNCLDKDMYLEANDVTINVLLNSADSPEGVNVTFTNYNEGEQANYGGYELVLDETGFYAFESFRKGEYKVEITFEGYEPIEDSVSIWTATDLRYVMTEIIYGVDNLYVSSTGWAMWDAQGAAPGPQPGPGGDASTFSENFDAGMPAGWTTIDANNDGYDWVLGSQVGGVYLISGASLAGSGHNASADLICSGSYSNATNQAITPDNYLVSPQVTLANGSTFSFWACAQDAGYPAEHFGVFVSDNGTSDWTEVQSWTMTAKSGGNVMSIGRDGATRAQGNWYQKTVDLSAFAGQKYIAIRHYSCNDQFILDVDDVELTAGRENGDRHLEYFKVMCTSIDGEPIYNADVPAEQPFCQLNVEDLVEGEHYIAKVAAVYSTGMSAWSECEWQYIPCENYAGTVNGITVEGTTVSWEYPNTPGPGPQPGQGSTFSENFDAGMPAGWTTVDANNDNYDWVLGSQIGGIYLIDGASLAGSGHNASADLICSGSYSNATNQAITPDNYLVSPQVTLVNGSTFSFWACAQDSGYPAEHFGVFISDNGTSNWTEVQSWTMTAKNGGNVMSIGRDGATRAQGNWYQKTVDLSNFAGQKYIAIRHFNCNDQFILDVDDVELTAGAKNERAAWDLMMTFNAAEAGHYGLAYDGTNFYTSNWGYSSAAYNFYKYDLTGNMIEGFNISGCGTLRGITYDGQYFYGVANSNTVYCVDLANHSVVSTFTSSYGAMRGITYDPVRDGFWVIGNWSGNLTLIDRTGAIQQTGPAPESASDLAYYKDENDVEHIYCFNNGTNDVNDWVIGNGSMGGSVFNFNNLPGTTGTSGGCNVASFNGKIAFMGNIQQDPNLIGIYELRDDTNPGPNPQPGEGNILGAMLFLNGEWEAFVPYPTAEYTYEEGGEYCVRMVYDGTNTLPEGNIYFSMSCPECEGDQPGSCAPGEPIHSELVDANHIKVWWGVPPAAPVEDWLFYDDGANVDAIGLTTGGSFNWGVKFPANTLGDYEGCSVTKVAYFDYAAHSGTVKIYNGSNGNAPATLIGTYNYTANGTGDWVEWDIPAVAFNNTQDLWIVMNNNDGQYVAALGNYTGDPNGTMISTDGNTWYTLEDATGGQLSGTWNLRCFVTNQAKGGEVVVLDDTKNGTAGATIGHSGIAKGGNAPEYATRATMVQYNVYRSTEATGTYEMIASVPYVAAQSYYEYIDSPTTAGTYYYQVRAEYDNECESEPAQAYDNPSVNYVSETTTMEGIVENGDEVALYPNPTNGNVTIEAQGMSRITVVSVLGQVVYDVELTADTYTMNMGQFNAGMYMVRVYTESGVTVKRVTVMQ